MPTIGGISTSVTALAAADLIEVEQGGAGKKATFADVLALNGDSIGNQSTANQTVNAATTAYLTGSDLAVPAGRLRVGTVLKWRLALTKTAAGTAANVFHVRVGTAGTTADTARLTYTLPAGTAAVDTGYADLTVTCRGPLSASGIFQGVLMFAHNLSTTGLIIQEMAVINVLSAAFDVTVANLIVGLSVTTAASTVLTFQQVVAEAKGL